MFSTQKDGHLKNQQAEEDLFRSIEFHAFIHSFVLFYSFRKLTQLAVLFFSLPVCFHSWFGGCAALLLFVLYRYEDVADARANDPSLAFLKTIIP